MNYILFGGSGFIGTHLIHLLLKECVRPGDVIYDLDLVMPGEEGVVPGIVEKNDGVQYIRLDVRKPIDFEFVPTPEDVIFDLAAVHRTPGHPEEAYFETNIRGAENVTAFAENTASGRSCSPAPLHPMVRLRILRRRRLCQLPTRRMGSASWWQKRSTRSGRPVIRPGS